jgi:hypothetical protein
MFTHVWPCNAITDGRQYQVWQPKSSMISLADTEGELSPLPSMAMQRKIATYTKRLA